MNELLQRVSVSELLLKWEVAVEVVYSWSDIQAFYSFQKCVCIITCEFVCCEVTKELHLQVGATSLLIGCQKGHLPVVKLLIEAKANVNKPMEVGCYT